MDNVVGVCPACVPASFSGRAVPCALWPGRLRRVAVCALARPAWCPVALRSGALYGLPAALCLPSPRRLSRAVVMGDAAVAIA